MEPKISTRRSSIFVGEQHTSIFNRIMAKLIDCLIVVAIYFLGSAIWFPMGVLAAMSYAAMQDGLGVGQSIGKRIFGLRVIEDQMGLPCSFRVSFIRNIMFTMAVPLAVMPILWILFFAVAVPLIVLELYLIVSLDSGVRLGDVLGNTLVVEHLDDSLVAFQ